MRRVRRIPWFLSLVCVAACAIPSRDNPNDSSVRPVAALRVLDLGPETRDDAGAVVCPAVTTTGEEALSVSRGQCLVLDASESTDPQPDFKSFTFERLDASGVVGGIEELASGNEKIIPLTPALRRSVVPGTVVRFRVTVRDRNGGVDEAETVLILKNSPPLLPAVVSRTLPLGGLPWAANQPISTDFSTALSVDPDGDMPVHYCWTFPRIAPGEDGSLAPEICSTDAASPLFTQPIDTESRRVAVAYLRVADSLDPQVGASSSSSTASIRVGPLGPWTFDGIRFDPERRRLAGLQNSVALLPTQGAEPALLVLPDFNLGLSFVDLAALDELDFYALPGATQLASDPVRRRVWSVAYPDVVLLEVLPGTTAVALAEWNDRSIDDFALDGAGRFWATTTDAMTFEQSVVVLGTSDEAILSQQTNDVWQVETLAGRPGTLEMWAAANPVDPSLSAALLRYTAPGSALQVFLLEAPFTGEIAWADSDRLWVQHVDRGLLAIDVALLESGSPASALADATVVRYPEILGGRSLVVDPATGRCMGATGTSAFAAGLDGRLELFSGSRATPLAFDTESGSVIFNLETASSFSLESGTRPRADGILARLSFFGGAANPSTGGIAAHGPLETFDYYAEDGTLLDVRTSMLLDGALVPAIGAFAGAAPSPDGRSVWLLNAAGILRAQIDEDPVVAKAIVPGLPTLQRRLWPLSPDGQGAWSLPRPFPTPFATPPPFHRIDLSGTETFVPPPPLGEIQPTGVAVARLANSLCVPTLAADIAYMYSVDSLGALALGTASLPGTSISIAGSASVLDGSDLCWLVGSSDPDDSGPLPNRIEIRAFDPATQALVHSATIDDGFNVLSAKAMTGQTLWLSGFEGVWRVELDGVNPPVVVEYQTTAATFFVP